MDNVFKGLVDCINNIVEEKYDFEKMDTKMNLLIDLGFSSIEIIQLVVEIEEKFDIVFTNEDMQIDLLYNLSNLNNMINRHLGE